MEKDRGGSGGSSRTSTRPRRCGWSRAAARASDRWRWSWASARRRLRRWVEQAEVEAGRGPKAGAEAQRTRGTGGATAREPAAADGARNPKKSDGLLRQGERVRFALIATEKAKFPGGADVPGAAGFARRILRLAQRPTAPRARPGPEADPGGGCDSRARAAAAMAARGCTMELRERGQRIGRKRVARLMRAGGPARAAAAPLSPHHRLRTRHGDNGLICWRGASPWRAQSRLGRPISPICGPWRAGCIWR